MSTNTSNTCHYTNQCIQSLKTKFLSRSDMCTRTALHWAAMNGYTEIVELLLEHGAVADVKDIVYSFTPLMLASRQGNTDIVKLLVNQSCDVNCTDAHGETALFDAVRNNQVECVDILLDAGLDIDFKDKGMHTPLMTAVLWKKPQMVVHLVRAGCDLNSKGRISHFANAGINQNEQMFSPFEAAVQDVSYSIATILYIAGCHVSCAMPVEYIEQWEDNDERSWLTDIISRPRQLKEHCRLVIRKAIGLRPDKHVGSLLLPEKLQNYVQMSELNAYI